MTIRDLKVGDILTYGDGSEKIISYIEDLKHEIKVHSEDLLHCRKAQYQGDIDYKNCRYDIVKVQRYVPIEETNFCIYGTGLENKNIYHLKVIYERKEILDKEEKEYLSKVIAPFRDKFKYISKINDSKFEYIRICIDGLNRYEYIYFPNFKKGTMYKGMKLFKEYSLEELGL